MKEADPVQEHRKQIIKAKWLAGATSGQIATYLGVTRNSVMGHVKRMKLIPGLGVSVSKDKKDPYKAPKDALEPLGPIGDFPPTRSCRAISGDVRTGDWQCCARPGYPYCAAHSERFWVKPIHRKQV